MGILVYYLFAAFLATHGLGVWSFILAIALKEVIEALITWYYKPWVPSLLFDIKSIFPMIRFGFYLQLGVILAFFQRSMVPAIAGIKTNPYYVGLLDWSSNVSSLPSAVNDNFGRVAFASFSKIQSNLVLLSKSVEKSMSILTIISLFFTITAILFGKDTIVFILNDKWLPALPALYWFIGGIIFAGATTPLGQSIVVLGRSKEILIASAIVIICEWIFALGLIPFFGFIGIAIASFIGAFLLLCSYLAIAMKIGIKINLFRLMIPKLFTGISTFICLLIINIIIPENIILFFIKIFLSIVIYAIFVYLFSNKDFTEIQSLVLSSLFPKKE